MHMCHSMKYLVAKIMVSLACAIILLHAMVPHHHHDCDGEVGFVFETELGCHCDSDCDHHTDCHHHGSHHPFDTCKLQDMLSRLVLTTQDDKQFMAALFQAETHAFCLLALPEEPVASSTLGAVMLSRPWVSTDLPSACRLGGLSLRAPPAVA